MNLYFELLKKSTFKMEDVSEYYDSYETARSAVKTLLRDGLVRKIRNNLYTCVSGETGMPVANRFQIASAINETACASHHTAMEYYGICDQVFYDVYVSSESSFREFEFDGYTYHHVNSKISEGVDRPEYSGGIAVTSLERTIIDSIKDMDKITGIEEVIQNVESVQRVSEQDMLKFMSLYDNQFLYQKVGFIMEQNKERLHITDDFIDLCKSKIGKSKRYLTNEAMESTYNAKWRLMVPIELMNMKNGVNDYADI